MNVLLILFISHIATCCFMQQVTAGKMTEVEDYLVSHVRGDDIRKNLDAVKSLVKSGKDGSYSQAQLEEFEWFLELELALHDEECSIAGYDILDKLKSKVGTTGPAQKVRRILRSVVAEHGKHCSQVAQGMARKSLGLLSKAIVKHVDDYTDAAMRSIKAQNLYLQGGLTDKYELIIFLVKEPVDSVWGSNSKPDQKVYPTEVLKTLLMQIRGTTDDVSSLADLTDDRLMRLYRDWIVVPCESYIRELSAFYDIWHRNSNCVKIDTFDFTEPNFTYYRYQICHQLVHKDEDRLLKAIGEVKESLKKH